MKRIKIPFFENLRKKKYQGILRKRLETMAKELSWVNDNPPIERIVDFFNYMEEKLGEITPEEREYAPKALSRLMENTRRCEHGWFRAPKGTKATVQNTYVQPTYPWDEYFRTHTVQQLLCMNDAPSDQGGFAKKPMTNKEFYNEAFVVKFMKSNYQLLINVATKELQKEAA